MSTLHELWSTVQTIVTVLEFLFAGAVVVMLVLVGCVVSAIWTDRGADAESAASGRKLARENPARTMPATESVREGR